MAGQRWPTWARALVWVLLLAPLALGAALLLRGDQTAGVVAIKNASGSAYVIKAVDVTGGTTLYAVPASSDVVIGRGGSDAHTLELMTADCEGTVATYSLDTGNEAGSVRIDALGSVSRDPNDGYWFITDASATSCPP